MADFQIDLSDFIRLAQTLGDTKNAIDKGAKNGMEKAVELWYREAYDFAPQSAGRGGGGDLRDGITKKVEGNTIRTITGSLRAEAWSRSGNKPQWIPFNYAYYIHEVFPTKHGNSFSNGSQSNTFPNFLDKPLENATFKDNMMNKIKQEINDELVREGW